jgi:prepilin peptidase CpaA
MTIFSLFCTALAALGLVAAAVTDFRSWKIPNRIILSLVALYIARTLGVAALDADFRANLFGFENVSGDLAAAFLLFVMGVVLWMFKLFGAGDAKLFFPIGLFIGWIGLMPFSLFLLFFGVVAMIVLKAPLPVPLQMTYFFTRLDEIRATRKVPYGVVMAAAALVTMYLRLRSGL